MTLAEVLPHLLSGGQVQLGLTRYRFCGGDTLRLECFGSNFRWRPSEPDGLVALDGYTIIPKRIKVFKEPDNHYEGTLVKAQMRLESYNAVFRVLQAVSCVLSSDNGSLETRAGLLRESFDKIELVEKER